MYFPYLHEAVVGYHVGCFDFMLSLPSLDILKATHHTFEPAPSEDKRRRDRIRTLLVLRLRNKYGWLPTEIWLMIAGYLVHECAISTMQELWRTRGIRQDFHRAPGNSYHTIIDMSLDVWVRYIHIDGIRYIAELSNQDNRSHVPQRSPS